MDPMKLIFEKGVKGNLTDVFPECDVPEKEIDELIPKQFLRDKLNLKNVSEVEVVRHYTNLSKKNYGVDTGFYPLGSCTMKYNPKVNEDIASLNGFLNVHPYQLEDSAQGSIELMYKLSKMLCEITGMDDMSLMPSAGAHGELTGLMIIKAFYEHNGDHKRKKIIIPDTAHGTNPASASMVGFDVVEVKSDENGCVDVGALRELMDDKVAGLMLTNPNTLGLFEKNIVEISDIIHKSGGLLYYDGANANAILGIVRPGDMGFDVVHLNLHKTFSTPHGGGGPGSGPLGVKANFSKFLPIPLAGYKDGKYFLDYDREFSIGRVRTFYGNFGVMVKAYAYIIANGARGLCDVSKTALIHANYLLNKLKDYYRLPFGNKCMHEFVLSLSVQKEKGVSALDVAKRLIDYGFHPPTIYFPLIVKEAMMIEPTETEPKEILDEFIETMIKIANEVICTPDVLINAPNNSIISRLDETKAARSLNVKWSEIE